MNELLSWIWKQFKARISETSTWVVSISYILHILELNSYMFLWTLVGIFMSETLWDKYADKIGTNVRIWLDKQSNK